jgi:hypothetical protein
VKSLTPVSRNQLLKKIPAIVYLIARYYAAFTLMGYGFAKVMGAQFTVLDSELAKPLGDVSGFWLTWYYFGYSAIYASVVAWVEILGAALLGFRRTALIGVLLLLPVMANIISIDLWVVKFPLESGALRNAFFVLFALLVVLSFHVRDIYQFFRIRRNDLALMQHRPLWGALASAVLVLTAMAYTAHEGYWLANVNNRAPTTIDGAWQVTEPHDTTIPDWIYFEYNRAYMTVFRFADGRSETHDFRVDDTSGKDTSGKLQIGQEWLTPGADIFNGIWSRSKDTMTMAGEWKDKGAVHLTLTRKPMQIKDHK